VEVGDVSYSMKMVIFAVAAILGIIGLIYAVIYVAVPIHALPGFVPGAKNANGHYHKRALVAGVIGVVLLVIAVMTRIAAQRSSLDHEDASGVSRTEGRA